MVRQEQLISKHQIEPDPRQPRKFFDEQKLEELRDSIFAIGLQNPITICPKDNGKFQIVTGERRWRAHMMLDGEAFEQIRSFIVPANTNAILWQMTENLQREGLNPIEEAQGYRRLISEYKFSQQQIASAVGKNRVTIHNALKLLKLPESLQEKVAKGAFKPAAARMLISRSSSQKEMIEVMSRLAMARGGVKKVSISTIAKYFDARKVSLNNEHTESTLSVVDNTDLALAPSEPSEAQRLILDAMAFADKFSAVVHQDDFSLFWESLGKQGQTDFLKILARVSWISRDMQERIKKMRGGVDDAATV